MLSRNLLLQIASAVVIVTAVTAFFLLKPKPEDIHIHAGFVVIENNTKVDFSGFKYMKLEPCGDEGHQEDEQLEKAHLHDSVGDVVHVHRSNPKWSDLFTNIEYPLEYSKVKVYFNGQQVENFQDKIIQPFDSIVILVGENDVEKALAQAVTRDHIEEVEKKSENCGASKK